jgi:hypothetical protein
VHDVDTVPDASIPRGLAWALAISFVVATLIILLLTFNISASEPQFHEGDGVLVDNILIDLGNQQQRWPQDLLANVLFAIGFAAVGGLGATLPHRLGAGDDRGRLVTAAFLMAATLGVVAELTYLGVKEVSINAQYCECALRDPQLISRAEALGTVVNLQTWLTDGFAVLFGLGLFAAAGLARSTSAMSAGWRAYTRGMGIAAVAFVLLGHLLTFVGSGTLDLNTISALLIAIVAGVLTPIWAVWTARLLRRTDSDPLTSRA